MGSMKETAGRVPADAREENLCRAAKCQRTLVPRAEEWKIGIV